ncbi:MAG: MMPL family transporter [Gammaproteobacteria bacterium]|nr:MMPL family transporter [Gammaproteobacteria bacterium]MDX2487859.1 MMPL family transporter [Gammaproteobacteria bacterium]
MSVRKSLLIRSSWFILLTLAVLQVFINTQIQTDIASFMPAGRNDEQRQLLEELQQGAAASLWLIAISDDTESSADGISDGNRILRMSQEIAQSLRDSGQFTSVLNGPAASDDKLSEKLFRYRYLLDESINKDSFSVAELRHAFQQQLEELTSPFSSFSKSLLVSDPTSAMQRVTDSLQVSQSRLETVNGIWYSSKEKRALLIANSKQAGSNIDGQENAYKLIQSTFQQSKNSVSLSLLVSGSPLFAVAARDRIRMESRRLSIAGGVFMLVFMFIVFRSGTAVLLTMLPLAGGLLIATALVSLAYGSIHGITLAFGITLLGVAIDYPVHLLMHAKKEKSLQQAAVRIWPVLRLGVITTALGYGAMVWTDFNGLSQLGVFSLTGLIMAALITRTLLPALKKELPSHRTVLESAVLSAKIRTWMRLPGLVLIIFLLASLASLFGLSSLIEHESFMPEEFWSHDIAALSPVPAELVQRDRMLRSSLGVPETTSLIRIEGNNVEDVLRKEEQLKPVLTEAIQNGYLSGTQSAADLLPSVVTQQSRQSLLPDRESLSIRMQDALHGLPFRAESFEPFLDGVNQTNSLKPMTIEDLQGTSAAAVLQSLLSTRKDAALISSSGVIRLTGLTDSKALAKLVDEADISQVAFINLRSSTNELMLEFRREMLSRIAWVAAVIMLVLIVGLRDIRRSLAVIGPVILAVLCAAMVPLWLGESLNIFHLVSLLLVTGLGLDYALFINSIHHQQDEAEIVTTSLVICSISSFVVFAMLALSRIPVLHAIGVTVASGVVAAFVFSWLFAATKELEIIKQ